MDKKIIVTISREYGSYGREIGRQLAKKLHIPYYDKEVLEQVAQKLNVSPTFFTDQNLNEAGLYSLSGKMQHRIKFLTELSLSTKVFDTAKEIMKNLAQKESMVLVGRCANVILKDEPNLISVYCYGDLEDRVKRVIEEYNVPADRARKEVLDTDRRRARFYEYYTNRKWGDVDDYDVLINTSKKTPQEAIEFLAGLYYQKEKGL